MPSVVGGGGGGSGMDGEGARLIGVFFETIFFFTIPLRERSMHGPGTNIANMKKKKMRGGRTKKIFLCSLSHPIRVLTNSFFFFFVNTNCWGKSSSHFLRMSCLEGGGRGVCMAHHKFRGGGKKPETDIKVTEQKRTKEKKNLGWSLLFFS